MIDINEIYKKYKKINSRFRAKYDYSNPDIFNQHIVQVHCELSELAYETKCFKYWKDDKPNNAKTIIYEYTDVLTNALCFINLADIEIEVEKLPKVEEKDINKQFIILHSLISKITMELDKTLLLEILSNLLNLAKLLDYPDEEMDKYIFEKLNQTFKLYCK